MQLSSASPALLGALLALGLSSGAVPAQMPVPDMLAYVSLPENYASLAAPEATLAPVEYLGDRLRLMMEDLERSSPTAADMLLTIRKLGYPLTLGTFADLHEEMQQEYNSWTRAQRSAAGYMAPVVRPESKFSGQLTTVKINVALNLALLDELFASAPSEAPASGVPWDEIQRLETLAVLGHELVHAYGLAKSGGDPRIGCQDPHEGESPELSCVMLGENIIRKEIGAPLDWDYGFPSAASLADRYVAAAARERTLHDIASFRLPTATVPLKLPARLPIGG